jgi:cephalosporin hydroxylase
MSAYMRFIEEELDMPLRDVLQVMQDRIMANTRYFGIQTLKQPLDFWIYQELFFEARPDVVIEIGNRFGGSTLALAHMCQLLGKGRLIGIDLDHSETSESVKEHPRISLVEGDACDVFQKVARLISQHDQVLIIEDSSHTYENTVKVLETYSPLVKPGGYFIVEDGICHHGLDVGPSPGPYEAVEAFVASHPEFIIDRSRESFLITWNPKGFLKRVK